MNVKISRLTIERIKIVIDQTRGRKVILLKRRKGKKGKEIKAETKEHKKWKNIKHEIKWKNKFKYFSNHSKYILKNLNLLVKRKIIAPALKKFLAVHSLFLKLIN